MDVQAGTYEQDLLYIIEPEKGLIPSHCVSNFTTETSESQKRVTFVVITPIFT